MASAAQQTYQRAPAGPQGQPSPVSAAVSPLLIIASGILLPGVLAYLMTTGSELRVVAALFGLLGMMVIVARPFWGLIFFLGLLYTRPEESIEALQGMRLPLLISVVTAAGLFFRITLNKEQLVRTPVNGLLLVFTLCV